MFVISIALKVEGVLVKDVTKWKHKVNKEQWTKYRTLKDTLGNGYGTAFTYFALLHHWSLKTWTLTCGMHFVSYHLDLQVKTSSSLCVVRSTKAWHIHHTLLMDVHITGCEHIHICIKQEFPDFRLI